VLAGREYELDAWEMHLSLNPSGTTLGSGSSTGAIYTLYTPDYIDVATGILISGFGSFGSVVESQIRLQIPALGIDQTTTVPGVSTITGRVKIENRKIWMMGSGVFRVTGTDVKWYVNGSLVWSRGSSFSLTSGMTGVPSSIPLFGIPAYMSGGVANDPLLVIGCVPEDYPGGSGSDVHGITAGGWRVTPVGGSPTPYPVVLSSTANISGTNTWDLVADHYYTETNGFEYVETASGGANVWILPNFPAILQPLVDDQESMLFRWGAHGYGSETQSYEAEGDCSFGGTPTYVTTENKLYPEKTQFLGRFPGSAVTDMLNQTIYAQVTTGDAVEWGAVSSKGANGTNTIWRKLATGDPSPALDHPNYFAAFINQWANPLWSIGPWLPDSVSGHQWDPLTRSGWLGARQQVIDHPALPSGDRSRHRVNVIAEPLDQNGVTGLCSAILGANIPCWAGISRFGVLDHTSWPASFACNTSSAPRFSFGTGTGTVGSTIIEVDSDVLEFEVCSFEDFPFMTSSIADRIEIGWGDNVASCEVFAVGADGTKVRITDTQGVHRIPKGRSSKWATSAAVDFGQGEIADSYNPLEPDDDSPSVIADELRISSFGLLPARTPMKIRWEIIRTNPSLPAEIDQPIFHMPDWTKAKVHHETGGVAVIMFEDGPMVRYGCLSFYDYFLDTPLNVPLPDGGSQARTMGDLWAWENCFLKGLSAQTGIYARMVAEFELNEEFTVAKHAWRDPDMQIITIGAWVQGDVRPLAIYSNTYRSGVPPLLICPEGGRDMTSLLPTGSNTQRAYSLIRNQMACVAPSSFRINDSLGHNILTTRPAPNGWFLGTFTIATTGLEGYDWTVAGGGKEWFEYRAWRGFSWLFDSEEPSRWVWNYINRSGKFYRAEVRDTGIVVRRSRTFKPLGSWAEESEIGIAGVIRPVLFGGGKSERVWVAFENEGDVLWCFSNDDGRTWSEPVSVMAGNYPTGNSSQSGWKILASLVFDTGDSGPGKIRLRRQSPGSATLATAYFAKDETAADIKVEEGTFHLFPANNSQDAWILTAVPEGETDPAEWISRDDGLTWKRVV
jgi:hypothetical protein